jgi:hypothetical protein
MARNAEAKAEAIAIGMVQGAIAASKATGIPRRTISRWLAEGDTKDSPVVRAAIVATEEAIADRLWETMQLGLEEVRAGLLDPKARLSDKARALEVIASQWQLITGRATSRTENANLNIDGSPDELSPEEAEQLEDWLVRNDVGLRLIEAKRAGERPNPDDVTRAARAGVWVAPADPDELQREIEAGFWWSGVELGAPYPGPTDG